MAPGFAGLGGATRLRSALWKGAKKRKRKERRRLCFNTFDGSGPTYAGFTATPDDPKKDDFEGTPALQDVMVTLSMPVRAALWILIVVS